MPMVEVIVAVCWGAKERRNLELWMDSLKIDLQKTLAMIAGWLVFRLVGGCLWWSIVYPPSGAALGEVLERFAFTEEIPCNETKSIPGMRYSVSKDIASYSV